MGPGAIEAGFAKEVFTRQGDLVIIRLSEARAGELCPALGLF
jgi:hypothetical protein